MFTAQVETMTDKPSEKKTGAGKAALSAAAIGSAAIAAALLYANKRKKKQAGTPTSPTSGPTKEKPETD
jgi:LPXTG-motif cell wall-anchored protein